jgi:DNA processing protein
MQQTAAKKTALDDRILDELSAVEQQIIYAMGYDPINIDDVVERTGMAVGSVAAQMIGLEIKGFVQQIGAAYQRV